MINFDHNLLHACVFSVNTVNIIVALFVQHSLCKYELGIFYYILFIFSPIYVSLCIFDMFIYYFMQCRPILNLGCACYV